jgi:tRNA modification GTPase
LIGPPNVGKSRLFNALLGRDRAIVSPHAGTTRDYLSAECDCDGLTVELVDTAGSEAPSDTIAARAQELRALEADRADLLLECVSADTPDPPSSEPRSGCPRLEVWTKADQGVPVSADRESPGPVITSAATGLGLDALRLAIASAIRNPATEGGLPAGTGARCRGSLLRAEAALRSAVESLLSGGGDELVALDLRSAVDELGTVVGAVVTDDILDRIFSRFCIGK